MSEDPKQLSRRGFLGRSATAAIGAGAAATGNIDLDLGDHAKGLIPACNIYDVAELFNNRVGRLISDALPIPFNEHVQQAIPDEVKRIYLDQLAANNEEWLETTLDLRMQRLDEQINNIGDRAIAFPSDSEFSRVEDYVMFGKVKEHDGEKILEIDRTGLLHGRQMLQKARDALRDQGLKAMADVLREINYECLPKFQALGISEEQYPWHCLEKRLDEAIPIIEQPEAYRGALKRAAIGDVTELHSLVSPKSREEIDNWLKQNLDKAPDANSLERKLEPRLEADFAEKQRNENYIILKGLHHAQVRKQVERFWNAAMPQTLGWKFRRMPDLLINKQELTDKLRDRLAKEAALIPEQFQAKVEEKLDEMRKLAGELEEFALTCHVKDEKQARTLVDRLVEYSGDKIRSEDVQIRKANVTHGEELLREVPQGINVPTGYYVIVPQLLVAPLTVDMYEGYKNAQRFQILQGAMPQKQHAIEATYEALIQSVKQTEIE